MKVLDYTGTNHLVSKTKTELAKKVDKVVDKGLSTNDYTDADKAEVAKIEGIEEDIDSLELTKADKTKLASTDRRLDFLYELTQGQAWDFDRDDNNAYEVTVPSGAKLATVQKYGGKSVVLNQTVVNGNFESTSGWTGEGETLSVSNNELIATINDNTKAQNNGGIRNRTEWFNGHKYYRHVECYSENISSNFVMSLAGLLPFNKTVVQGEWCKLEDIITSTTIGRYQMRVGVSSIVDYSIGETFKVKNVMVIDLTQMFGAGNEPTTVEQVKAILPNDYYEYNTGEVIHADVDKVVEQGVNVWDEEWESGHINSETGQKQVDVNKIRSKNYIPVSPSTSYYFKEKTPATYGRVLEYDANKNYIKSIPVGNNFTTDANAHYILFVMQNAYGTTYNHDISINYPSTDTSYHSYRHSEYPIPTSITSLEGYGWSAGSVYNEVDFERKKFIKRIGRVNLGTLGWNVYSASKTTTFRTDGLSSLIKSIPDSTKANIVVSGYTVTSWSNFSFGNMTMAQTGTRLALTNDNCTTLQDFKDSIDGVYLYYELSTPVETDITDILDSFTVEAGGTITFHNSNGDGYRLPVPSTEEYTVKLQDAI